MVEFPPGKELVGIVGEEERHQTSGGSCKNRPERLPNFPGSFAVNIKDKGDRSGSQETGNKGSVKKLL